MGKGGSAKQEVNEYRMSLHFGIGAEVDALEGIFIGERLAWSGSVSTATPIAVSAPELFGGQKKEGGVGGTAYFLPGRNDQVMPAGLAARRGLASNRHPGYRGVSSVYFVGTEGPGEGFWWGNTPYMQPVWAKVRRAPKGLAPDYAMIGNRVSADFDGYQVTIGTATATLANGIISLVGGQSVSRYYDAGGESYLYTLDGIQILFDGDEITVDDNTQPFTSGSININGVAIEYNGTIAKFSFGSDGQDANPIHIIYECLTNSTWGMGSNDGIIDRSNFETVARVIYNEAFGMSLMWTRETTIEAFVSEVLDHIQAALYVDPDSGKITIKLFRDDYDATTLPQINPDNADLDNYQRKLWGETINEIVVTWTNPINEQDETITQQDLGNITVQGAVVSDSRNYYGVRNAALAQRLALRDSRQSAAPLASVDADLDRTAWNLKPGSIIRLSWPEYDIFNLVMRVVNIDYGKVGNPQIKVSLLEDIFSLEDASYEPPPLSSWINPATDPTPMDYVRVITAPAYFSSRFLSAADAAALTYPDVLTNILAASGNPDAALYELVGQTVLPNGDMVSEEIGTRTAIGYAQALTALPEEATTLVPTFGPTTGGSVPSVAGFVFIGNVSERTMEIALLESVSEDGWVLQRGVLDTVPRAWPIGTSLWFYDIRIEFFDQQFHGETESVNYKLLTMTSKGRLSLDDAPIVGAVMTARPHLPNRPANVIVGGVAFGPVDLSDTSPTTLQVSWANRNRTLEDGTIVKWTDATVFPEVGQTTTIRVVTTGGTILTTHAGLTGTSFTLAATDFGAAYEADVQVLAVRDGLESLQFASRRVRLRVPGYGDGYGDGYGGPGEDYTPPPVVPPPPPPDDGYDPGTDFPDPWTPPGHYGRTPIP